jgi:hypothetical protein
MTVHEVMGRAHAAALHAARGSRALATRACSDSRGQGTVEYVGLILLIAVLIAGVVQASRSFTDTGIAQAVVKKIKGAIDGVAEAK